MHKKNITAVFTAGICALSLLAGCGTSGDTEAQETQKAEVRKGSDHEPITILSSYKDMSGFLNLVHEKYPEINLEIIPYSGNNYSAFVAAQLESGDMPDIYSTKVYTPGRMDLSDKLLDLSAYDFTSAYSEARLRDVTDNGAASAEGLYGK